MDNYETPNYRVAQSFENESIEIREYEPMVLAEVTVDGDRGAAANRAFRILVGYIGGKNQAKQDIAMTSPVTQQPVERASVEIEMTSPVTQQQEPEGDAWVVAFKMPARFTLETLPNANDERIRFRETKPNRVAAIRFNGSWSDESLEKHRQQLESFLQDQEIAYGDYHYAFYDSPFTLPPWRRNEVIYELND